MTANTAQETEGQRRESNRYVGRHHRRLDSEHKVDGSIEYTGDIPFEGLHASLARSTVGHASIESIDISAAEEKPGVEAVITGKDLESSTWISPYTGPAFRDQPLLAIDTTRYNGEPIAAVVAQTERIANEAVAAITVDYDRHESITSLDRALEPGAPSIHESGEVSAVYEDLASVTESTEPNVAFTYSVEEGDVSEALDRADVVVEGTYSTPMIQHAHLESHVTIADYDRSTDSIAITTGNQTPHYLKQEIARLFDIPTSKVSVEVPQMGGSYGSKTYARLEPLTAALSRAVEKPVRLQLSMDESSDTGVRDGTQTTIKTGVTEDGDIIAQQIEVNWDTGAYADIGPRKAKKAGYTAVGAYDVENVSISSNCVYTNKPPGLAYRGFGVAQTTWAMESHVDVIAAKLDIDPYELRVKNVVQDGGKYNGKPIGNTGAATCVHECADVADWVEAELDQPEAANLVRGRGMAIALKATITPSTAEAIVLLDSDGSVSIVTASTKVGQGVETTLAQIVAESLAVDLDNVSVEGVNTDVAPFNTSTTSSRTTFHIGNALLEAADDIKTQLIEFAATNWGVDSEAVTIDGATVRGPGSRQAAMPEIISEHFVGGGGTVIGRGYYSTKTDGSGGYESAFWMSGATVAEVTVDRRTGKYSVDRWVNATDAGTAIDPERVRGQIQGAAAQGLGHVQGEEIHFENDQQVNKSLLDYKVPSIEDVPDETETVIIESNEPDGPFGAKGVGEINTTTVPPAVSNAIFDAAGVRVPDLPVTPEKIFEALKEGDDD